jgi:hypothetical protein
LRALSYEIVNLLGWIFNEQTFTLILAGREVAIARSSAALRAQETSVNLNDCVGGLTTTDTHLPTDIHLPMTSIELADLGGAFGATSCHLSVMPDGGKAPQQYPRNNTFCRAGRACAKSDRTAP